jgi:Arc/MetJ family transcription regulator
MCMREPIRETRTNIVLDDALIAEAAKLTGIQTRRALVHEALRVLIEQRRRRPLAPGYDHKAARAGEP